MRTLNEIGADLEALDALLSDVGGDVTEEAAAEAVDAWLAELKTERNAKLDRFAAYMADLTARAAAKKTEAARLTARASAEENRVKFLKARLLYFMQRHGDKTLETPCTASPSRRTVGRRPSSSPYQRTNCRMLTGWRR